MSKKIIADALEKFNIASSTQGLHADLPPNFNVQSKYKRGGLGLPQSDAWIAMIFCISDLASGEWHARRRHVLCDMIPPVGISITGNNRLSDPPMLTMHAAFSIQQIAKWWNEERHIAETNFVIFSEPSRLGFGRIYALPILLAFNNTKDVNTVGPKWKPVSKSDDPGKTQLITNDSAFNSCLGTGSSFFSSGSLGNDGSGDTVMTYLNFLPHSQPIMRPFQFYSQMMDLLMELGQHESGQSFPNLHSYFALYDVTLEISSTSSAAAREGKWTFLKAIRATATLAQHMAGVDFHSRFHAFVCTVRFNGEFVGKIFMYKGQESPFVSERQE